jgi:alkylation response protein AidB-like acyl-CoA dehydrogenase
LDFEFSENDVAFRKDIRRKLAEILPADVKDRHRHIATFSSDDQDQRRSFRILDEQGWSVPGWPAKHGGPEWSPLQRFIFEDEMYQADAPEFNWVGTHMVGPVLYTYGSEAQQARFLAPIRRGEHLWAQGFSEPGAGSDLAGLRTNARLDGERFILNGQKIWTSGAFFSDWGIILCKTDTQGKPQQSISFLLVDLKSPGVTIRRIQHLNNEGHLCEVFLENVEVPADQLVGEMGKGWTYAKFLLDHERTTSSFIFWTKRELRRAWELALVLKQDGRPLAEHPEWAMRLAKMEAEVRIHEWSVLRVLAEETAFCSLSVAASVLKLRGAELQQSLTQLHVDMLGIRALREFDPEAPERTTGETWPEVVPGRTSRAFMCRAATIYGGTLQIQKNILAKLALGL